jgi:hypothetical protein
MMGGNMANRHRAILSLGLAASVAACATSSGYDGPRTAPVAVDLRLRDTPDAPYRPLTEVTVPHSHVIGDGMFPYEGIGWENGFVGYRLYLDGRLTSDAFGKQQTAPALSGVSSASRYHEIARWGMDVLHVGPSLGMGGLGVIRDGQPRQFGQIGRIAAKIDEAGPERGAFTIRASDIATGNGSTGAIVSRYSIDRTSPLTRVSVRSSGDLPLATGIVANANGQFLQSVPGPTGNWRYIATFGAQSENKDNLGIALFYRADQARYGGMANETHFVAFDGAAIEYAFLAAWERDASGVRTVDQFKVLLDRELERLQGNSRKTK